MAIEDKQTKKKLRQQKGGRAFKEKRWLQYETLCLNMVIGHSGVG